MNSGDPYNITYRRQRFSNNDRGEEELEDIELGDKEYLFGNGKETMADDDKTTFNSLMSTIKELTTGQKRNDEYLQENDREKWAHPTQSLVSQ